MSARLYTEQIVAVSVIPRLVKLQPLASIIIPQVPLEGEQTLPVDDVSKFYSNKFLVASHSDTALLMLRPHSRQKIALSKYSEQNAAFRTHTHTHTAQILEPGGSWEAESHVPV